MTPDEKNALAEQREQQCRQLEQAPPEWRETAEKYLTGATRAVRPDLEAEVRAKAEGLSNKLDERSKQHRQWWNDHAESTLWHSVLGAAPSPRTERDLLHNLRTEREFVAKPDLQDFPPSPRGVEWVAYLMFADRFAPPAAEHAAHCSVCGQPVDLPD